MTDPGEDRVFKARRLRERVLFTSVACLLLIPVGAWLRNLYIALAGVIGMFVLFVAYLLILIFGCARFTLLGLFLFTMALGASLALTQSKDETIIKLGGAGMLITLLVAIVIVIAQVSTNEDKK